MINQTLINLRQQQPFSSKETAVLIAPALSQKRFERERDWGKSALKRLWQRPNVYDFVSLQGREEWSDYETDVVLPTFIHLTTLEQQTSTRVIPDITYSEFCEIVLCGRYQAVFLVAHHIQKTNLDAIEFADGARPINEITSFFLQQKATTHKVNLLLFVCQGTDLKVDLYTQSPLLQSVAAAGWNMPLHESVRFIYHWCACLDGKRTLIEAYHQAIDNFK